MSAWPGAAEAGSDAVKAGSGSGAAAPRVPRASPSAAPDSRQLSRRGLRARHVTPSLCSSEAMNGLANTRSSLAALRARVYSLAFSNGCSAGSRLRCTCSRGQGGVQGWRLSGAPVLQCGRRMTARTSCAAGTHLGDVLCALPRACFLIAVDDFDLHGCESLQLLLPWLAARCPPPLAATGGRAEAAESGLVLNNGGASRNAFLLYGELSMRRSRASQQSRCYNMHQSWPQGERLALVTL